MDRLVCVLLLVVGDVANRWANMVSSMFIR